MEIPNPVLYVVGDVLGSWYYSHTKLNTLFAENGAPGEPPEGNCVKKCQAWLKRVNSDPEIDATAFLGKVLAEFMSWDGHGNPRWQEGYDRIQKVLADSKLAYHPSGMIVTADTQRRFAIALSFPGERRAFIEDVASHLVGRVGHERVLYDKFYEAEFAGPDLDVYLPNLYRTQSELVAVFLCTDYAKKRWCRLEWRFIRQMICTIDARRIMFLSFDDIGAVPEIGILSGDGYVSIGLRGPKEIGQLILQRLTLSTQESPVGLSLRDAPTVRVTDAPSPSPALGAWQKKLAFLQVEEAKIADAEQRFAIQQRIEEAKEKIRALGGQIP